MSERIFTLSDANRALPLVRSITRDAVRCYLAAKGEIRSWEALKALHRSGGGASDEDLERKDRRIASLLDELRRLTDELEALGCRLRDVQRGVVDFPAACLGRGHFVYYCWALDEKRVRHWRGEEETFDERHLVEAEAAS